MINLEWYRTFKAVYEEGNLTKASEVLYSSQPGVSLHISSLESYVGYKLFERTSRKMIPTVRGMVMYDYIIDALKKLEKAEQHFRKKGLDTTPTLSIGMCSEVFQYFFEPHIAQLDFDIIAHFGEYPQMIKELNEGILDLVITPKKINNNTITYTPFFKEKIQLIAGINTDTSNLELSIKNKEWKKLEHHLSHQTWYCSYNIMEYSKTFWSQNFNKKQLFKPNYIVPDILSIIRCLSNNKGMALVPDFLCSNALKANNVKLIWEGFQSLENTFYFAVKENSIKLKKEISQIEKIVTREI
ncbi:LysR family transcriptional regulator [Aquimarina muelleri]|uniref:LysR family transcriptional regulator n=1 Tax=Aquimarina muelleri TaxID=279356 RepID=A0A918JUX1_9FLAO|nr:LysR family transcriptional regulator [Aquimarina muelleri]MCX2763588.1 LysR family transcriptional regulator [Aquimarina muelleri]GGX14606.1 LysR family transcriptional regulator [Aquimarina muelleri]